MALTRGERARARHVARPRSITAEAVQRRSPAEHATNGFRSTSNTRCNVDATPGDREDGHRVHKYLEPPMSS